MDTDKTPSEDLEPTKVDSDPPPTEAAEPTTASGQTATPIPTSIGSYRILSKLGEGGMGVVYEAQQQHPRRKVAVKVVRGGQFVDDHRVRMFQREADTLARLKHPNIGGIYESGRTEDGQHFFTMELVRGQTLDAYMQSRPSTIDLQELRFRVELLRKIVDAVHYAVERELLVSFPERFPTTGLLLSFLRLQRDSHQQIEPVS